jgi:hypothetical protein
VSRRRRRRRTDTGSFFFFKGIYGFVVVCWKLDFCFKVAENKSSLARYGHNSFGFQLVLKTRLKSITD